MTSAAETIRLIGDGETRGGRVYGGEGRRRIVFIQGKNLVQRDYLSIIPKTLNIMYFCFTVIIIIITCTEHILLIIY